MTPRRCTQAPTGAAAEAARAFRAPLPVLETARLVLRAPRIEDLALWTEVFLAEWAGQGDTEETAWEEFSYYSACWLFHGHGLWTVERKSDGAAIGFVLVGLEWTDDEPELGYIFADHARRQGYAAEACSAARDHALALLGPGGLVSYVHPGNAPSNALAKKLGAVRDGAEEARIAAAEGESIVVWRHGVTA
ncbi:GNAT family N-acetyltransferase [Rhodobacterales bacterium HKCCE3408]|nr:GNAT family N-acetyltransferase [Rhodobacterales bacterium HKCCE3408]